MNYAVAVDYLTLPKHEKRILHGRTGEAWAEIAPFSIADVKDQAAAEAKWPRGPRLARLIVLPGGAASESDDDIARSFSSWSGSGKEALEVGMRVLVETCRDRDCELLVWPRVGSLVSDIPGLLSVCRKHEDVGIFLEPAALFPEGNQFRLADFVDRLTEVIPLPGVRAVFFDAASVGENGGLAPFAPLARIASELGKPIVLRGVSGEDLEAVFGSRAG